VVNNFAEVIENVFLPLFETLVDPASHPDLADVLSAISGIDSVDDESVFDTLLAQRSQIDSSGAAVDQSVLADPRNWTSEQNPPYSYHAFFLQANIRRFNDFSSLLGHPWRLTYRPHAGEWGEVHHLATAFLLADGINHGVKLMDSPVLQYLFYVTQMGVSVSPVSNNAIFLQLRSNPFPDFFKRGLNCTLSTDDPLIFHQTVEPLLEEYTVARLTWDMSHCDLAEIAANSVRQSGFPREFHQAALGEQSTHHYGEWDENRCSIPIRRIQFRAETLAQELVWLRGDADPPSMRKSCSMSTVTGGVCRAGSNTCWKATICWQTESSGGVRPPVNSTSDEEHGDKGGKVCIPRASNSGDGGGKICLVDVCPKAVTPTVSEPPRPPAKSKACCVM
jgi:AMP deaminase